MFLFKILRSLDVKSKPLTLLDCTIISSSIERPTIGSTAGALDEKREEQQGVSYDLRLLQNEVDNIMRKFFQARQARLYTEDTKVFEKHSQHDVRVKLTGVAWGDLKDFVKEFFLDDRNKYIFFSEVEIDPDYPKNKSEVYNATFHISSVEFSK